MALNERIIALNFTDFETEYSKYRSDTLRIYNGSDDSGIRLETLAGSIYPSEILFTGKSAHLKFISNEVSSEKGFRILLKTYGT